MILYWLLPVIWFVLVVVAGIVYVHPPSLGRKPLSLPSHKPDYVKIARLERELGMAPPEPFIAPSALAPKPKPVPSSFPVTRASGGRCWAPEVGTKGVTCYSDCGVMPWGKCPYPPRERG
jgi:hypothetical protein